MRINETLSSQNPYFEYLRYQKEQDQPSSLPSSWGSDQVSFSEEALSKVQSPVQAEDENQAEDKADAKEEFGAFMDKAKGKVASSSDPEAQIKALQEKLAALQQQLDQAASGDQPGSGSEARINSLNTQINAIMEQIAEAAKQAAAESQEA